MTDLRLALPACVAWLVAVVLTGLPGIELFVAVVLWVAAIGGGALCFIRPGFATASLACAAAALCATSLAIQSPVRAPLDEVPHSRVTVMGITTSALHAGDDRVRVQVSRFDSDGATVAGAAPVLAFVDRSDTRVGIGSGVTVSGRLTAAAPGESVSYLLFAEAGLTLTSAVPWYLEWANALRTRFAEACGRLPGPGGDLLAGLAIGDTSAVTDELDSAMKASSLSHLTAVSGANCAIVVGLVLAIGSVAGVPRAVRIGCAIAVLAGFVVLVTPEPSVLRAAIMAAIVLVAMSRGRPVAGMPVVSLAVLVLIVLDPWLAREYGFILSVLATTGLITLSVPLARRMQLLLGERLSLVLAVPIAAQLACQPVIIMLDAALPTYGIVANVLAGPAAPVATVVGLTACVLFVFSPPLAELLLWVAWVPSAWIAAVAQFFAAAPLARLPWPEGWAGAVLLAGLTVVALLALRYRWARWATLALVAGVTSIAALSYGADRLTRPADWQIAMCDVGQGDATVVRSGGRVALIDTGAEPVPLADCLSDLGIARIDLLVLTHFDLDHVGGASAVVGRVSTVLVGPTDGAAAEHLVTALEGGGAEVREAARGDGGLLGQHRWTALWPAPRTEAGNDASVVLEFEPAGECGGRCLSIILLGDLGAEAQSRVVGGSRLAPVDVVKVSHHGSADQDPRLYERLRATVGLIGVGAGNGYGHPTDSALAMLENVGTRVARTDRDGLVLLAPSGTNGVMVWRSGVR